MNVYGSRFDLFIRTYFWQIAALVLIVLSAYEAFLYGISPAGWDPLVMSAVVALIAGMWLGLRLVERVLPTLQRLEARGSLEGDAAELAALVSDRADRYAGSAGVVVGALLFVSYFAVYLGDGRLPQDMPLVLAASLGGYLGGRVIGRMVAVGQLGSIIRGDTRWSLRPQLASLDGAAGLAPVGHLFFRQASVLFIPAVFLMVWWLIIPLMPRYADWRPWYMAFLIVAIGLELIAFVWPMWSFHVQMKEFRDRQLIDVEAEVSHRLAEIEPLLVSTHDAADRAALKQEIGVLRERYASVTQCPTWPVDRRVRRKFSIRNLVLLVPLVIKLVDLDQFWSDVAGVLGRILGED